jgi:hypothetical protein
MELHFGKELGGVKSVFERVIDRDRALSQALRGMEIHMGLSSDPRFGTPAHAQDAMFVADKKRILGSVCDSATEALLKSDADKVVVFPQYNAERKGWNIVFKQKGAYDAAPDIIAGQLFSPWNISFFTRIFREPLSYSNIGELLRRESGDNPWAEIFTLLYEQYVGYAMLNETGSMQNQHTNDVNVINGIMSAPVINLSVTYTLTIEEIKRDEMRGGNPFSGQGIIAKHKYSEYTLNMLNNYVDAYGNTETDTGGLLSVSPVRAYAGKSVKAIFKGSNGSSSTTRGSDIYRILAQEVNDFLSEADNKYNTVKIAVCPEVHNYLNSAPYSDIHSPQSAAKTFAENYLAGKGPGGSTPVIEFVSEPLFKPKSIFNEDEEDYCVICAPEIGGGPDDERQPLILSGVPLRDFIFPAIPGMYNTQYKTIRRIAGVFAPVPKAVRVYKGFGIQSGD